MLCHGQGRGTILEVKGQEGELEGAAVVDAGGAAGPGVGLCFSGTPLT